MQLNFITMSSDSAPRLWPNGTLHHRGGEDVEVSLINEHAPTDPEVPPPWLWEMYTILDVPPQVPDSLIGELLLEQHGITAIFGGLEDLPLAERAARSCVAHPSNKEQLTLLHDEFFARATRLVSEEGFRFQARQDLESNRMRRDSLHPVCWWELSNLPEQFDADDIREVLLSQAHLEAGAVLSVAKTGTLRDWVVSTSDVDTRQAVSISFLFDFDTQLVRVTRPAWRTQSKEEQSPRQLCRGGVRSRSRSPRRVSATRNATDEARVGPAPPVPESPEGHGRDPDTLEWVALEIGLPARPEAVTPPSRLPAPRQELAPPRVDLEDLMALDGARTMVTDQLETFAEAQECLCQRIEE